ncbi:MAG TPA: hypothetical protein VK477_10100 [Acidobacteriota bacterium]|nr:hypothetical protein [Acidobacteriota bacterium]
MRSLPLLAFLTVSALAQTPPAAPSLQNLVQNSPFGSAAPAGQAAAAAGPLEFRGTFVDRGERFFSILDTGSRRAEWIGLKESGHPYTVKSYDPDSETVTLDYQGRSMSLKLRTARITAMSMPPPQASASPQPVVTITPGGPAVGPASNTTEAQRLAQVAEEIRRRRALRQQAQQQQPPGPTPPPNQPPR